MPSLSQTGDPEGALDITKCAGGRPAHGGLVGGLQQQGRAQGAQLLCPVPQVTRGPLLFISSCQPLQRCPNVNCLNLLTPLELP